MQVELQDRQFQEFRVAPDVETSQIFISNPRDILDVLFKDNADAVFLLRGSGFSMDKQLQTWIDGYKTALKNNESLEQFRHDFIEKTIQDVTGFYYEYLSGQDIFPIGVDIVKDENGNKTIYATKYKKRLQELALPEERDGALSSGVDKAVEKIIESGPETVVFLNSPAGWSGLTQDGKEIVYPVNQTYVYWIDADGNLDGTTIRTNIDLNASEKLVNVTQTEKSNKERIKEVVRSPKTLKTNSIEKVLDKIEEVSGRKFDKQRKELLNRDKLFNLNDKAKQIVENLRSFLTQNVTHLSFENIKLFATIVGKSILDLSRETLEPKVIQKKNRLSSQLTYNRSFYNGPPNYYALADMVKKIPGCNGGGAGNSLNYSSQTQTPEYYSTMSHESMNICQNCHTTVGVSCGWCKNCWNLLHPNG